MIFRKKSNYNDLEKNIIIAEEAIKNLAQFTQEIDDLYLQCSSLQRDLIAYQLEENKIHIDNMEKITKRIRTFSSDMLPLIKSIETKFIDIQDPTYEHRNSESDLVPKKVTE